MIYMIFYYFLNIYFLIFSISFWKKRFELKHFNAMHHRHKFFNAKSNQNNVINEIDNYNEFTAKTHDCYL